ncbi:hypothetical protein [Rouxiella badensis]|jgi:outer membrane lipoprotein SlyB|uniref:Glycine zipper 2TM domain n=1 Tax=Rouxiella badensis TaxID=1646377 RepID=A0A1X0WGD5_9GAMM|nr:hypothetical protein [Rouxiella badensis]MCC3701292.1 hypothetical protein [Rouxiella badensis]MCC3717719.1 hypothetical protein [Rouxiella badensis]MCC3727337.1 hypothetical protein [Rouxiella badensis]MCC3734970.1 hypothetical protein [Rouxiella badensis]MCC3739062.1 hypothetical protein [Rouxiella badensis]
MRKISCCFIVFATLMSATTFAHAEGCLKGAAVGAVAGHVAHHHAVLGAVGGCVVGHHMAAKAKKEKAAEAQKQQ